MNTKKFKSSTNIETISCEVKSSTEPKVSLNLQSILENESNVESSNSEDSLDVSNSDLELSDETNNDKNEQYYSLSDEEGSNAEEDVSEDNNVVEYSLDALPDDRDVLLEYIHSLVELTGKHADQEARKGFSRKQLMQQLSTALGKYFCYNMEMINYFLSIFSTKDTLEFLLVNDAPRPLVIRCNRIRTRRKDLAKRLISRGCQVDVLGDWSKTGLLVTDSTVPVGATPEYLAGHYMIMAASSFLPVLALDAQKNEHILEMAAAPGGKSTFIAEMMENTGILVANDLNKKRLNALLSNIHRFLMRNII